MAAELLAGLGIFKSMLDTAKGLKDMNDTAVRNAAVIELQEKILSAQAQQTALVEQVGKLEEQVAEFEKWDADKQRYQLAEIAEGQFAYVLKEGKDGGEPAHKLCANCYSNDHKAILQTEVRNPGRHTVLFCQSCGAEMFSPETGGRDPENLPTRQNSREGSWVRARRGR